MEARRRIFVTGANRGLGKQLVHLLAKKDFEIHITSRSSPEQLAQLFPNIPSNILHTYRLDIRDSPSISKTVQHLESIHTIFDFIVANAAVGYDSGSSIPSPEVATSTLKTNVDATIDFTKQFLPLLSPNGRIIIVSSEMSALDRQPKKIQEKLSNPDIKEEQILELSSRYIEAAMKKEMSDFNWSAYSTSKALINAWGRFILPRQLKEGQSVICMHPGWCRTDMGGSIAPLSASTGASRIEHCLWIKQIPKDMFFSETRFVSYMVCE